MIFLQRFGEIVTAEREWGKIDPNILSEAIKLGSEPELCAISFGLDSESLIDKNILLESIHAWTLCLEQTVFF